MTQSYLEAYKAYIKAKNSICAYCKNKSVDIIAVEHNIKYVCSDHFINPAPDQINTPS